MVRSQWNLFLRIVDNSPDDSPDPSQLINANGDPQAIFLI